MSLAKNALDWMTCLQCDFIAFENSIYYWK